MDIEVAFAALAGVSAVALIASIAASSCADHLDPDQAEGRLSPHPRASWRHNAATRLADDGVERVDVLLGVRPRLPAGQLVTDAGFRLATPKPLMASNNVPARNGGIGPEARRLGEFQT